MEEKIKDRLDYLYKQLDQYYEDFSAHLSTYEIFIIQNKLSPLLQTISSIAEMYYNTKKYNRAPSENRSYIYALVRANNLLKHNKIVIEVIKEETKPRFSFPISGPFQTGLVIIAWKDVEYKSSCHDNNKHGRNQIFAYKNKLIGQDISIGLRKGIKFLKELRK